MARTTTATAEERIQRINERHRLWQREHPEKMKEYRERYILRKAERIRQEAKERGKSD